MAVNAPFNANANVPARSMTSSTGGSDIARVYRIGPPKTVELTGMKSEGVKP
jgi:hypothetical protein